MAAAKLRSDWNSDEQVAAPALVGSLSDVFRDGVGDSPAHLLQHRLAQAYLAPPAAQVTVETYALHHRAAIIVALTVAMWLVISGVSLLAYALLA